jgi:hypothetical protein
LTAIAYELYERLSKVVAVLSEGIILVASPELPKIISDIIDLIEVKVGSAHRNRFF